MLNEQMRWVETNIDTKEKLNIFNTKAKFVQPSSEEYNGDLEQDEKEIKLRDLYDGILDYNDENSEKGEYKRL